MDSFFTGCYRHHNMLPNLAVRRETTLSCTQRYKSFKCVCYRNWALTVGDEHFSRYKCLSQDVRFTYHWSSLRPSRRSARTPAVCRTTVRHRMELCCVISYWSQHHGELVALGLRNIELWISNRSAENETVQAAYQVSKDTFVCKCPFMSIDLRCVCVHDVMLARPTTV